MASSPRFRRQVKHVITKKCWHRWKRWCSCNENRVYPDMEMRSTQSSHQLE